MNLARFPRRRYTAGRTPIEKLLRLSAELGGPTICAGTDGVDGPTDAAGALATGTTVRRARAAGMDPADALERNDAYAFFDALDDLVRTGPTGTNVMDLMLVLVGGAGT